MPLHIRFSLAQQNTFELHCLNQSRPVAWPEVESLAASADRDYFADDADPDLAALTTLGRALYQWLDGPQAWLRAGLANSETVSICSVNPRIDDDGISGDVCLGVWLPTLKKRHRDSTCYVNQQRSPLHNI
jgi:hypothetical protein